MNNQLPPKTLKPKGSGKFKSFIQWIALLAALILILMISIIPLGLTEQLIFAMLAMGFTFMVRPENESSRFRLIVLMVVSFGITCRYIYWRITESMGWFDPEITLGFWDHFFSMGLLAAEIYAWTVLFLGFIQSIWPLRRPVLPLPVNKDTWPAVDVYIPTYNEPLNVVIPSILAARDLDWPKDKLNVYVLDDGCRPDFAAFAKKVGVRYIQREDSTGAKAGNINNALRITDGEYIAVFDSDHAPVRSFLKKTMGWFIRDGKLGLLQTPHLFFTPDPVERNLDIFKKVPNEGQLFYGLIQDGNDNWNAAFFCGSCAVLRRGALNEIGGITADTVTEDAHTSLKMHKQGWNSAYLNMPLAAGLATEKLSHHIAQRRRWARGMIQIFRKDNPLFTRGLSFLQRLSYFNAMLHFLFSLPRLVFLTAPLAYLLFEIHVIQATAAMIAVYALPHIFQAHIANAAMQGRFRHSFWAEVYETILAPHIIIPTLAAFFAPNKGKFNVTDKGGMIDKDHFDWGSAGFIFFILVLNLVGLVFAYMRYFHWNTFETDTVILNFAWTIYNTIIVGAALSVAWEKRQRRKHARVERTIPAEIRTADGRRFKASTGDLSIGDLSLQFEGQANIQPHEFVDVFLFDKNKSTKFRARVATSNGSQLGLVFEELTASQLSKLVYFSHGREKGWTSWYLACEPAKPFRSFFEIIRFGVMGVFKALFKRSGSASKAQSDKSKYGVVGWVLAVLIVVAGSLLYPQFSKAEELQPKIYQIEKKKFSIGDLSNGKDIHLRGGNTDEDVWFSLPVDLLAKEAELVLGFSLSGTLLSDYQALTVSINEQEIGRIPVNKITTQGAFRNTLTIDPVLISYSNRLSFKLEPIDEGYCERLDPEAASAVISAKSALNLTVARINLINDLSLFPAPFFDSRGGDRHPLAFILPEVLRSDTDVLKAGSILASWFGTQAGTGLDFPVVDNLPTTHSVLFITPETLPEFLSDMQINGPGVSIVSHPDLDQVKFLAVFGRDGKELIQSVSTLVAENTVLEGERIDFSAAVTPAKRKAYDAPLWLSSEKINTLGDFVAKDKLKIDGLFDKQVEVKFRVPPDLYSPDRGSILVNLNYQYEGVPLNQNSGFDISLNGQGLYRYGFYPEKKSGQTNEDLFISSAVSQSVSFPIMINDLAGENNLSLFYDLEADDSQHLCVNKFSTTASGTINPDSTIDLSGFAHHGRFPNLATFANLGFPFTRMADLSETAVVLSENPSADDLHGMFNLMAKMGADTGLPAYQVSIIPPSKVSDFKNYDLLVLGKYEQHGLISQLKDQLPAWWDGNEWQVRQTNLIEKMQNIFNREELNSANDLKQYLDNQAENAVLLAGFRSPYSRNKNVVVLTTTGSSSFSEFALSLNRKDVFAGIHGEVSVVSKTEIANFRLFPSYYSGDLHWFEAFRLLIARHVLGLFVAFFLASLIAAWAFKGLLKEHARARISSASAPVV